MNFVPRPVMKSHSSHEDSRPLPGYESNKRGKWDRLHRRLAHSQPYLLVFTTSDRFIAEYLGVMLVMHKSVTLKYALEGRGTRTEKVPSVHQLAVHLVLDKGHQNARENEPATNLQTKGPRKGAFGQLKDEVRGMPKEAPAGLEEPLLETQNSMRAPSSTTRFGGMLKKSVAALALRAMKLNRRFRHRIIGAGPVGRSRELST